MYKDIKNGKSSQYVPYHKIGFKILNDAQLENLFPNYESLLGKIDLHRKQLQKLDFGKLQEDSQYNLMYDNVFSIMGKRGAGKTSVAFTLKKKLETKKPTDLVLPVIMPEIIPDGCSIIGWILSLMEEDILDLDSKLQKKQNQYNDSFSGCLYNAKSALKSEYDKIKELCYSLSYKGKDNESFSSSIVNTDIQTQNSFDFSRELARFWSSVKKAIMEVNDLTEEPLIYIIFDDVDLMPDIVESLFLVILKYLSHPNLIVLVTADEESMYDVIENSINSRNGKYQELETYSTVGRVLYDYKTVSDFEKSRILEKISQKWEAIQEITKMYVDKILPPSSRYYLQYFETCERKSSFIEQIGENGEEIDLTHFFAGQVERYIKELGLNPEEDNFLYYNGDFIKVYFIFGGNTSRQLANECFIVEDFISSLIDIKRTYEKTNKEEKDWERYSRKLFDHVYSFAYNTLNANGNIGMTVDQIKELLEQLIEQKIGKWDIYLNYSYLKEILNDKRKSDVNMLERVKEVILLGVMMFFIENALLLNSKAKLGMSRRTLKIHGKGIFIEILDQITKDPFSRISLVRRDTDAGIGEFLWLYGKILEHPEILMQFDRFDARTVRKYFNSFPHKDVETMTDLKKYNSENPLWFKTMTQLLYLERENLYDLIRRDIPLHVLDTELSRVHSLKFEEKVRELKKDMVNTLLIESAKDSNNGESSDAEKKSYAQYLMELQEIAEEIIIRYKKFEYYEVKDGETAKDLVSDLPTVSNVEFKIIPPFGVKERVVVDTKKMNNLLAWLLSSIAERQERIEWQDVWNRNNVEELSKIYMQLCDLLEIAVITGKDKENKEAIDCLMNKFKDVQKQYLQNFLAEFSAKKDVDYITYKTLYDTIQKTIEKNSGDYLSEKLKDYIREGVEKYVDMLVEGNVYG